MGIFLDELRFGYWANVSRLKETPRNTGLICSSFWVQLLLPLHTSGHWISPVTETRQAGILFFYELVLPQSKMVLVTYFIPFSSFILTILERKYFNFHFYKETESFYVQYIHGSLSYKSKKVEPPKSPK
jgi:hypothetical protein